MPVSALFEAVVAALRDDPLQPTDRFRIESGDTHSLAVIDCDGGNLRRLTMGKRTPRYIDWGLIPSRP